MKRILIFSITYHPYIGGAEIAIKEITDRIPDVHFDMVTLRLSDDVPHFERIGNVNIHRIGFVKKGKLKNSRVVFPLSLNKYFFTFYACLHALRLHKKHAYNMTWAMMANYAGFAALFFKILKPNVKYLLTLQEGDPLSHIKKRIRFVHPIFLQIFKKADAIQTISTFLKKFAKDAGYTKKIFVIPNGVDTSIYKKYREDSELESYKNIVGKKVSEDGKGINGENIVLVTASRLVYKNGVDTLIKSLKFLPQDTRLVVIGDGPLMISLKDIAEDVAFERVLFTGFLEHDVIPKYLSVCDIFVRPSRSEGFGNSFIEAMACSVPIVGTEVGGITDFLFDPEKNCEALPTGLFAKVDNPESVARAVMKYVKNTKLKEDIIKNAQRMVVLKYEWNSVAKQMNRLFIDVMK